MNNMHRAFFSHSRLNVVLKNICPSVQLTANISRHFSSQVDLPSECHFNDEHLYINRQVPVLPHLQEELLHKPPEKLSNSRLLQVAVLGMPNAGKSTLVNQLVGWNICTVSKKVHTTRKTSKAVMVDGETQVIFLDTPGCVDPTDSKKHHLESSFLIDPEKALMQSDLLIVLHDVSYKWTARNLGPKVLRLLHLYPEKKSILVLNKIDKVKEKRKLLDISQTLACNMLNGEMIQSTRTPSRILRPERRLHEQHSLLLNNDSIEKKEEDGETLKMNTAIERRNWTEKEVAQAIEGKVGWPHFERLFMISALDGDGIADIKDYLIQSALPAPWFYNSSVVTDQNPQEVATATLKGQLLELLPQEVPYKTHVSLEYWDVNPAGALNIVFNVSCPSGRTVPILIGTAGRNISVLNQRLETELRNIFRCDVKTKIYVTSPSDRRK